MAIRITGMNSGLDTESIIKEMVAAKQTTVDEAKKAQTKLEWKQTAWKDLNAKIYKLFTNTLGNLRFSDAYAKKTTKVSNPNAVSVITGANAVNGVQNLRIDQLAKTGYLTGSQLSTEDAYNADTVLTAAAADGGLGLTAGSSIAVKAGDSLTQIDITEGMKISDLVSKLKSAGVNASFDEKNQRFFISATESGEANDFAIMGLNTDGINALNTLGVGVYSDMTEYADYVGGVPQKEIDATVASRLKNILATVNNANEQVTTIANKMKEYGLEEPGDGPIEMLNNIEAFKSTETYEKLTDKQKEDINKQMIALDEHKNTLLDAEQYYETDEDGVHVAKQALIDEVTTDLETMYSNLVTTAQTAQANEGTYHITGEDAPTRITGSNAVIYLNDARFENETNTFEINGLTYSVNATTAVGEEITITTEDDNSGIYDMIKGFLKEYNALINEMDKLYNADSASKYQPLTEEEKEAMSEKEVEKWEQTIKDSLLRRDSTLSTVSSAMKTIMMSGVTLNDGSTMYLSDLGIETLGYFDAADNEKNAYHILGDKDDTATANKDDKLATAIANNSEKVEEFFISLSRSLYGKLNTLMASSDYSSAYTVYNDKSMKKEYDDYTSKISELEKKLTDYEDKWYAKFSDMEVALSKLQSGANAVTSLLGGGS